MLSIDETIKKIDHKTSCLGSDLVKYERLGRKDIIGIKRNIMKLYAYKVFLLTPNGADEKQLHRVIDNALKTINNV